MEIFGVPYPIDLIPIPIRDVSVLVGMDWLSRFGAMIDCEGQGVVVRTPNGGELVIYGEGTRIGSAFVLLPKLGNILIMIVWVIFLM